MKHTTRNALATLVMATALVAIPMAAWAGTSKVYFNVTVPIWQGEKTTAAQTKAYGAGNGDLWIEAVGSTYKVDAQMCSLGGFYCNGGTKIFGLDDWTGANLPNIYAAGTNVILKLWSASPNAVNVQVQGNLRSN